MKSYRYDHVLIWGNGLECKTQIINEIRNHPDFEIIKIYNYKPKNIKKFVKAVYSFDYAPFHHLKAKTKYLLTTKAEVIFIFFKNNNPDEDYLDNGDFRHLESHTLKKFKEELRNKFNERKDDKRTENHVIHASDSQKQTDYILKYLGFKDGIEHLSNVPSLCIKAPYHFPKIEKFTLKMVDINKIYCTIANSEGNSIKLSVSDIQESPHYKTLIHQDKTYEDYLNNYQGVFLQDNYCEDKFLDLSKTLNYLKENNCTDYIIVSKLNNNKYMIMDGLHRAAILKYNGVDKVIVAVVE
jgi:hypothetical protein